MYIKEILFYMSDVKYLNLTGKFGYFLLSKLLSFIFWMSPEIRCLYLAGSMASGDIIPGLSDIDFVLVIKDLSCEDEYRFINNLEARLRYLMPPFGKKKVGPHVAIYSVSEWALLGDIFLGKRYGPPKRVFEKDKIKCKYRFDNFTKGLHHFYKAQWRLETLQQNLSTPAKRKLDALLRVRMMERCFHSIINGFNEIQRDSTPHFAPKEIKQRIRNKLNTADVPNEQSYISDLLPELIHLFNLTVFSCIPTPQNSLNLNNLRQMEDVTGYNKLSVDELAKEITSFLEQESKSNSVYICRIYSSDFFLYDTANYELSEKLIKHYIKCRKTNLRILSKICFEHLFLNHPSEPFTLMELKEQRYYQAQGFYSHETYILDAYSTFPQLRSPINFSKTEKHEAYLKKIYKLLEFSGAFDCEQSEWILPYKGKDEYERFRNLKILSLKLTAALTQHLEAENQSLI